MFPISWSGLVNLYMLLQILIETLWSYFGEQILSDVGHALMRINSLYSRYFRFSNNDTEVEVATKSTDGQTSQLKCKNCSVSWKIISILIFFIVVLLCFGMFAAGFFYGTRYKNRKMGWNINIYIQSNLYSGYFCINCTFIDFILHNSSLYSGQ